MSDLFLDEIVRPDADDEGGRSARRAERAERARRRRQRRRRNLVALTITAFILGGIGAAVWKLGLPLVDDLRGDPVASTDDYPGPGVEPVTVTIPPGATGADMAEILLEADVIASVKAFTRAFAANPDASKIQPGTYQLMTKMRAVEVVAALINPDNRVVTRVTIVEGYTVQQVLDRLSSVTAIPVEEFRTAMEDTAATGLPAEAGGRYEGWLYPATYEFEPDQSPAEMIAAMIAQTVKVLDERGVAPADRQRVLTIASLIEKEAKLDEDRPKIARAIFNRLNIDMPLQVDAAVAYGLNKPGKDLTLDDISPNATDNPYNTYAHNGLPPGPIASPRAASIDAVLAPADGPWIFWVTVNPETGETRFAETYAEHKQNEALLRQWEAENDADA
ncbi:MAG: endolytic transglycosylase MltG [Actinomycetales bacterium]|nr:endolytic transglycosylase MltG [Actinomycetales bacterium]